MPLVSVGQAHGSGPNILVITVDTFRPDHLGAYGYDRSTSPHIDSIAAQGVVFRNAYTTSAWTAPGLISLLTSMDAPSHGVDVRGKRVRAEIVTLADALKEGGYRAPDILFLSDIPNFHNLGFELYVNRHRYIRSGDEIVFRWLKEEAAKTDRPFFLYHHYRDLHLPFNPGPSYEALYLPETFGSPYNPISWARRFLAREKMDLVKREIMISRGIIDFAPWDRGWIHALYDAQICRLDTEFFARLRRVLRETGLADSTLLVISADHGEELMEDGLVGHVSTFQEGRLVEELIRIPLIFAGPGIPSGHQVTDRVQVVDVAPTILDIVGLPRGSSMQGRSLKPLMSDQARESLPLFFETTAGGYLASVEHYAQRTRAVIDGDWKLVSHMPSGKRELYDLSTDPMEEEDLIDDHPETDRRLHHLLSDWIQASQPAAIDELTTTFAATADAASIEILSPVDGDTLHYVGADQTVGLCWTGEEETRYRVLYEVGEGTYHFTGEMVVDTNAPSYGPFHASFWNSVVLYSPFTVRVHPEGRPDLISAPVTFYMTSSTGAGAGLSPLQAWVSVRGIGEDLVTLVSGSVLGLVDLSIWLTVRISAADVTGWALLLAIAGALIWPKLRAFGEDRVRAWAWLLAYVGLVYSTIPVFPQLWGGLRSHTGDAIRHLGMVVVILGAVWVAHRLVQRVGRDDWRPYVIFIALLIAYGILLDRFGQFPAERLHLLEYGLMGAFVHRALAHGALSSPAAYVTAWVLTILIGFGDETIQWILPQRYFELKDVGLNAMSGALGLGLSRLVRGGRQ